MVVHQNEEMTRCLPDHLHHIWLVTVLICAFSFACDTSVESDTSEETATQDAGLSPDLSMETLTPPPALGEISGRVVDINGVGLGNIIVLCCSEALCVRGETDTEGDYLIENLEPGPRKMELFDTSRERMSVLFWQEVIAHQRQELDREVVLPTSSSEPTDWNSADGGDVSLANGALILSAAPGSLLYPPGAEERVRAEQIDIALLPPYDTEPWHDINDTSIAYYLDPVYIEAESPVNFTISSNAGGIPGSEYTIWSLQPDTATLEPVGSASADLDGTITNHEDSQLHYLSMILLIPVQPSQN